MKHRIVLFLTAVSLYFGMCNLAFPQLVSYWNFDDGEAVTDQVGSNNGTVLNEVEFSEDTPDGSAYSLDLFGVDDYVRIGPESPNGPDFGISETDSFTISFWVNYVFSQRGIVTVKQDLTSGGGDRSGFTVGIGSNGMVFVGIIPSITPSGGNDETNTGPFRDINTDLEVPLETWTHLAVTYDSGTDTLAVYMDGEAATMYTSNATDSPADDGSNATGGIGEIDLIDSNGSFTGFGASGNAPQFGGSPGDFTRLFYDGLLDEVAIWNVALESKYIVSLAEGADPREVIGDSDGDGLSNDYEGEFAFLDPNNPDDAAMDEDKDGLSNLEESRIGTVPNDADSDDDGLKDGEEINTHDTDPMKADSDKDGLNDNIEIAKMTDPNNPDSDGDNLKDGEEVNMHKTNPTKSDSDGDGVDDAKEIAWGSNPNDANDMPAGPTVGLVSYWNFDDGEAVTDQVGPNNGTVLNEVEFSEDTPDGSAYSLDLFGVDDYVRIGPESPNGPDFGISETDSFTISFWVNYVFSQRGIVTVKQDLTSGGGDRSGFTVGIGSNGMVFVGIIPSITPSGGNDETNTGPFRDINTDLEVPLETWTHLAVTYDSGTDTLAVYMDGEAATMYTSNATDSPADDGSNATGGIGEIDLIDSNGSFTGFGASGNAPQFGGSPGDFTRLFYDGLLDEVAIWNVALESKYIVSLAEGADPREVIGDSDGDGLSNDYEGEFAFLDPNNPDDAAMDEDKDGLSNLEESRIGTVPNDADSDDDGLKDGEEINTHDTDPMKADSDKDGLNDNIEIAKMTDPNNPDSDGDNLKDGEEVNMHKTNPTKSDSDGDGVDDAKEIAWGSNPNDANDMPAGPTVGLVSYWNFDDGEAVTDQVGPNNGTVLNEVEFSEDTPDGSAYSLDLFGVDDYVRIGPESPNGPDFGISETDSFTISFWVNYEFSQRGIVTVKQDLTSGGGDRSGFTVGIGSNGMVFVGIIPSITPSGGNDETNTGPFRDINTDLEVPLETWTHLAATYDSETDTLAVYMDGEAATMYTSNAADSPADDGSNATGGIGEIDLIDSNGSFTGFGASGNAPQFGGSPGDFTRLFYDGLLDDVAIWNVALSEEEVKALTEGADPNKIGTPPAPFLIKDVFYETSKKQAVIVWNSKPARTYTLEASTDLTNWMELDDEIPTGGKETRYIETNIAVENKVRFYRVIER